MATAEMKPVLDEWKGIKLSSFEETVVDNTAVLKLEDKELFYKGTDIPKDTFKEIFGYINKYLEETGKKTSDITSQYFKKNKKIDKVSVAYPFAGYGTNKVTYTVERAKKSRNPKTGDVIVKPGISTANLHVREFALPKKLREAMKENLVNELG